MSNPTIFVVPLTDSQASRDGLRVAIAQAKAAGLSGQAVSLHLLHVTPRLSRHASRFLRGAQQQAHAVSQAAPIFAQAIELAKQDGVTAVCEVRLGDAATEISHYARTVKAAKVILATSRASQFTRLLKGSVSARLSAMSQVPVELHATQAAGWDDRLAPAAGVGVGVGLLWAAVT